ncbi:unknown [Porphyromonas sp. CAG:1061]|nr:unknown [Porphyromonas sp. CAG:1061]
MLNPVRAFSGDRINDPFRMRAECIPHGYGIYSARIRNRFRTVAGKMVIISSFPIPL